MHFLNDSYLWIGIAGITVVYYIFVILHLLDAQHQLHESISKMANTIILMHERQDAMADALIAMGALKNPEPRDRHTQS
jgi:hypothetical protein